MAEMAKPVGSPAGAAFNPGPSILLVDDDPANLLALRSILGDRNLVEAHSGQDALRHLQAREFAVVLLDVQMPDLDGFETAKRMRQQERSRHTPIIFQTAHNMDRSQLEQGYALGAVDFLVKPLVPIILRAKVASLVELYEEKEKARREADQLRLLVHGTTDYAIFLLDPDGRVASWNSGAERIKQYAAQEIVGQHFSRFYPQEAIDQRWPERELEFARRDGRFEDEGWRVRKDGTRFWANVVITALPDGAGNLRGFSKITRDMTERMRAEENARRLVEEAAARRVAEESAGLIQAERERLHVTLASIGDAVISTDAQGRITFLNSVAESLVGWKADEAARRALEDVFHIVNEGTRQPVENPAQRALRDGTVVGLANHTVLIAKDGTERPIDDSAAPIRDAQSQVIGSVLVFRDISERKRSEELLRQQQEWLRVTLASIGDAVITTDTQGRVTFLNGVAQELTGWTSSDAEGQPLEAVFAILHEQTRQPVEHPVAKVMREGKIVGLGNHTVLVARDGTQRPIDDSAAPIRDAAGQMIGVVLIFRDVTEQRRGEQHRNARLAVTHALNQAATAQDGAVGVLHAVCESLAWDVGFFWTANEDGTALVCRQSWHRPDLPVDEFETASFSRTLQRGQGLPGRVWAGNKPAWILDLARDTNFPRLASAAHCGLHSAFACPVIGDQTLGVIEFFTRHSRAADADLLELMATVAGNLGQFIERKTAEEQLRRNEQELADFFENATVGLHWVGHDGTILRANRAELAMLGYSREEYVGHPIGEFHADEEVICDILKRLQAGEKLAEYPATLRCKDGSIKDVLIDSSVYFDNGQFVHTRCFTRDITDRKRAEAARRESEEKLRLLADTIPQLAWMAQPDGHIFWYNRRWYEYTGTTPETMDGWGWQVVHDPDVLPKVLERWKASIASGEPFEMVFPLKGTDGQFRSFLTRVNPLKDEQGCILYWFGTNTDISEIKKLEDSLRAGEERFRQLADAMPQIVWTANPDGIIDYYNRQWHELSGTTATGGNEAWGLLLHAEDRDTSAERWSESLRSGTPFEMELRLLDRRHRGYRWHLIRTVAAHNEAGEVIRWYGTSTDIHLQKRAGDASRFLANASVSLAGLVDYESTLQKVASLAVPFFADWVTVDIAAEGDTLRRVAVAHVDPSKIELANDVSRRFPPDVSAPRGAWNIVRTGESEMVSEITDALLAESIKDAELLRIMRELGLRSYLGVPLRVRGKTLGVITFIAAESGIRYDASDLAVAEDLAHRAAIAIENADLYGELREADRRKDEFLATLAHELRNPLAPIRNSVQILKMPRVDAAIARRTTEMMERQLQHLVRLVDDLLDVSRIMRGKIELRQERVELASVVARAMETAQPFIEAQGHELAITLSPESLLVNADPVRLAQVVANLLTNAAKYTETSGRIWLKAHREGDQAVLRVRDSGIGIAPDMLSRIFELFVQVDHAATRSQGGLGIGLTLVKNLVEMHGGTVKAQSTGLGNGSEFIVRLPLATQERKEPDARKIAEPRKVAPSGGHRLLVVDDNKDAALSLAMLLRLQGHEVWVAHSGPAALEMVNAHRPELIFLDIGMPGMDGYEVARRLRQQPGLDKVVLAALTGWGQQEDRRRSAEAGFNHHLVKPAEPEAVNRLLADLKRAKT